MTRSLAALATAALLLTGLGTPARAASCYDLWYERNAIYASYGYCFRTQLGRETFGRPADCTSNPRLTRAEQRRVDQLRAEERRRACKVN